MIFFFICYKIITYYKYNNKEGLPQGLSISGLLSEIYLFDLVQKYSKKDNLEEQKKAEIKEGNSLE